VLSNSGTGADTLIAGFAAGALVTLLAIRGGALGEGFDSASLAGTMVVKDGKVVAQDIAELHLADAAVKAFNQAGPFPNPPQGIIDSSGEIKVPWEFILRT